MRTYTKIVADISEGEFYKVYSESGKPVVLLTIKEWESQFLNKKFGMVDIDPETSACFRKREIHDLLHELLAFADAHAFGLLEAHCDTAAITLVPFLEEMAFRLVDTRISFVTLIQKPLPHRYPSEIGDISFAELADLDDIIHLTHKSFTNNHAFFSRFKNRDYFTRRESEKYYAMWIENHIADKNTLFAVTRHKRQLAGYSFFYPSGTIGDIKLYKAILTAVDPEFRGYKAHLSMQTFLFDHIPEEAFYLDNTTQLTNIPAIKNNMNSRKTLDGISMIFYRQHPKNAG